MQQRKIEIYKQPVHRHDNVRKELEVIHLLLSRLLEEEDMHDDLYIMTVAFVFTLMH